MATNYYEAYPAVDGTWHWTIYYYTAEDETMTIADSDQSSATKEEALSAAVKYADDHGLKVEPESLPEAS